MKSHALRRSLALIALLGAVGCIPIPYKPDAKLEPEAVQPVPADIVVSASDDEQTEALAKRINKSDPKIKVRPHRDVADVAFPNGDTTLAELLEPARRERLKQESGITYLVLVGDLTHKEISHLGGFIPLLGLGTFKEQKGVTAAVVDLEIGESLGGMSATTEGRTTGAIYGFYGLFLVPMMDTSVYEAVADGAARAIRERTPEGPVYIIVANVHGYGVDPCAGDPDCVPPPEEPPPPEHSLFPN